MHVHSIDISLELAFFLGAVHALEPGHGKTAMLVYLTENRRSYWHPIVIGIASGLAHSVSLVLIALVVHATQHVITGDHHHENHVLTRGLQWVSSLLVIGVGLWMLWLAWKPSQKPCGCAGHRHTCDASDVVVKAPNKSRSYSMSALLGVACGLLPCPSALAAFFAGMSSGSPVTAYGVIALFAAGIACALAMVGLVLQRFGSSLLGGRTHLGRLPWHYLRAILILAVGIFSTARVAIAG